MPSVYLRLNLGPEECRDLYTSYSQQVTTRSTDGRNLMFPRRILQGLVQHNGIQGLFRINYSASGKFISIERVAS